MVDKIKTFSRVDKDYSKYHSIKSKFDDSLLLIENKMRIQNVTVKNTVAAETQVVCDHNSIEQVFMNLISNAIDAMVDCEKREVCLSYTDDLEFHYISIQDNGSGMEEEAKEKKLIRFLLQKRKVAALVLCYPLLNK